MNIARSTVLFHSSVCRYHNLVLSSFFIYYLLVPAGFYTTGVTCGAGTTYPSGAPDFNPQILVEFCVVMSVTISANKCSVRPDLQLFVGELVSYLRYLCLLSYSGAQCVLCFSFICLRLV